MLRTVQELSLEMAEIMAEQAKKYAVKNNICIAIAIMDNHGI